MNVSSGNNSKDSQNHEGSEHMFYAQEHQLLQLGALSDYLTASHYTAQAISSAMSISLFAHIQRANIFPNGCFPQHFTPPYF